MPPKIEQSRLPSLAASDYEPALKKQCEAFKFKLNEIMGKQSHVTNSTIKALDLSVLAIALDARVPELLLSEDERTEIRKFVNENTDKPDLSNISSNIEMLVRIAAAELAVSDTLDLPTKPYRIIGYIISFGNALSNLISRIYAFSHLREESDHWLATATLVKFIISTVYLSSAAFVSNLIYTSKVGRILAVYFPRLCHLLGHVLPERLLPKLRTIDNQAEINYCTIILALIACAFIGQGVGATSYMAAHEVFDTDNFFCRYLLYPFLAITGSSGEALVDFTSSLDTFDGDSRAKIFQKYHVSSRLNYLTLPFSLFLNLIGIAVFTIPPFIIATRKNNGEVSTLGLISTCFSFLGALGIGMVAALKMNFRIHTFIGSVKQVIQTRMANCIQQRHFLPLDDGELIDQAPEKDASYQFLQSLYHQNKLRYRYWPWIALISFILPNAYSNVVFSEDMFSELTIKSALKNILYSAICFYSLTCCSAFLNTEKFTPKQLLAQIGLFKSKGFLVTEPLQPVLRQVLGEKDFVL